MEISLPQVFIGIDISKDHFDIYMEPICKKARFNNDLKGIKKFIKFISNYNVGQIVCEASGGYETILMRESKKAGYKTWIVEPRRIKGFKMSEGVSIKTDESDAKLIALFASQKKPSFEAILLSDDDLHLRSLIKRKQDLTDMISAEKKRFKQAQAQDDIVIQKSIKKIIELLEKELNIIVSQIEKLITINKDYQKKDVILQSVPGIGKATSAAIIAQLPELGKISGKQISSLVGVAPRVNQSGRWKGNSYTGGGRAELRHDVYMAALTASRSNKILATFYQKLINAGKKPKVALIAVIRKLLVILNAMFKKQEVWQN